MEFSVRLTHRIDLKHLCKHMQSVLQTLLNLPFSRNIEIKCVTTNDYYLATIGDSATLQIEGSAEARLMILDLPYDESNPLLREPTVIISAGNVRTELSWVCVIALAIALGDELNTIIIDDSILLSSGREIKPACLLEKIKLVDPKTNILLAARELLKSLNII
jgi:hypothetical protein